MRSESEDTSLPIFTTWMVRTVLTVAFYDPFQPIFDFAESAHAAKYARRIGDFPARNAALGLGPFPTHVRDACSIAGITLSVW